MKHGDIDNYVKLVLDALKTYIPDERVVRVEAEKAWAADGQDGWIDVEVWEYE